MNSKKIYYATSKPQNFFDERINNYNIIVIVIGNVEY